MRRRLLGQEKINHGEAALVGDGDADVIEDRHAFLVAPVVENLFHQIMFTKCLMLRLLGGK